MTNTTHSPGRCEYDVAFDAIREGRAAAHALWILIADEHERDGYALRPMPWEGAGEYQRVSFSDGRDGFVRVPHGGRYGLPIAKARSAA